MSFQYSSPSLTSCSKSLVAGATASVVFSSHEPVSALVAQILHHIPHKNKSLSDFNLLQIIDTGSGVNPTSYSGGTGGCSH